MIHRERVADDVYTFQSDVYAQVNAGAIIGQDWAVVIDTLAFPDETLAIREFIEDELKRKVRYVINTHYHADHYLRSEKEGLCPVLVDISFDIISLAIVQSLSFRFNEDHT